MPLFDDVDLAAQLQQNGLAADVVEWHGRRAANYLRVALGVEFTSRERTFTARITAGRDFQSLPGPVTAVESVTVDSVALVEGSAWEWSARGVSCPAGFGASSFGASSTSNYVSLAIAYTSGFAEVPAEIVDWAVYLTSLSIRQGPVPGVAQETVGGVFVTNEPTILRSGGLALPGPVLADLRARYGTRPAAGTVRLGW